VKRLRLQFALLAALALAACDKIPQPKRIQVTNEIEMDLLVVRLPEARALGLIPKLRNPRQAEDATKEILKLIASREATLLGWPFLTTKAGQRTVSEQVDEFRYATEFDPPGTGKVVDFTAADAGSPLAPVVPVDPRTEPPTEPAMASKRITESINAGGPTAFGTRNLGVTLEVEPNIGPDGRSIDLNIVPQHVRLRGMRKVISEGPIAGHKVVMEQPEFVSHKVTTSLSVQDGDYTLLGVFNVPDMPGEVELFILHTRIKRIEVPSSEVPPTAPTPVMLAPELGGDATRGGQ
jgi:hypothetical protein